MSNFFDDPEYIPTPAGSYTPTETQLTRGNGIEQDIFVHKDKKKGDYIKVGKHKYTLKQILKAINNIKKKYKQATLKKLTKKEITDFVLVLQK